GYTGTQARATYTCVGNAVNLAARLESYTKEAGRAVLLDEETVRAMGGEVPDRSQPEGDVTTAVIALPTGQHCEALGPVLLKGKANPVYAYALRSARSA
ncbi:MAG: hypothetical protein ACO3JL_00385, partial [Myxococcota bacterium]